MFPTYENLLFILYTLLLFKLEETQYSFNVYLYV